MKHNTIKNFLAAALVLAALFVGCKKDDVTAPVVTLSAASVSVPLGSTYNVTATAIDDVDGDISSKIVITGTANLNAAGTYTLTYSATDAAGNVGSATLTVNVVLSRDGVLGNYSTTTTCTTFPYNTVATSTAFQTNSSGDKFVINLFYYNGGTLICTLNGSTVTVDAGQNPGPPAENVTGSGTFNATGKVLTMNYTWHPTGAPTVSCSVTYTRP